MTVDGRRRRRKRARPAEETGAAQTRAAETGATETGAAETGATETGAGETGAGEPAASGAPHPEPPSRRGAPREPSERGLRDLAGSGHSMLGVDGALRARDVNRPTDDDLADAERDVVIVRRHWTPDGRS